MKSTKSRHFPSRHLIKPCNSMPQSFVDIRCKRVQNCIAQIKAAQHMQSGTLHAALAGVLSAAHIHLNSIPFLPAQVSLDGIRPDHPSTLRPPDGWQFGTEQWQGNPRTCAYGWPLVPSAANLAPPQSFRTASTTSLHC